MIIILIVYRMYFLLKEMFFLSVAVLYTHKYAGAGPMQVYREARGRYWSLLYHPLPYHLETGLTKLEAPILLTLLTASSLPGFLLSASLHPELQAPFMP